MTRSTALVLTALTGFSGLVYEVAWQRYLATLLGSHSEASAAVLGIFLGGLAVGYELFGRLTRRLVARSEADGSPPRLLLYSGRGEAGIGCYVVAFPWLPYGDARRTGKLRAGARGCAPLARAGCRARAAPERARSAADS